MECELNCREPNFLSELTALMKAARVVDLYGLDQAKDEGAVLKLVEEHRYRVESYTILNFARLLPKDR